MSNHITFDVETLDIRVLDMGGKTLAVCLEESVTKNAKSPPPTHDEYGNGPHVGLPDGIADGNYSVKIGKTLAITLGSGSTDNYMDHDAPASVNVLAHPLGTDRDVHRVG